MTGNPQLTERQETLLRQAEKCQEIASKLRAWNGHYDQNCAGQCAVGHIFRVVDTWVELGIGNKWDLIGFSRDYNPQVIFVKRCAHDGTPNGAAAWLEQHALILEAQV